ncbi:hypothetical protein NDN08_003963 [Rhodosorus marinus]|uniref:Phycoerythrobilin:ferredoxin oxidoreductase n=1 Tax=Rhodosorus marinus TaxID=101924 RepID=A0AAV8UK96_9RHOD|nr:hypothetical protein NDN08_003963 [Rhodosorus marinus]
MEAFVGGGVLPTHRPGSRTVVSRTGRANVRFSRAVKMCVEADASSPVAASATEGVTDLYQAFWDHADEVMKSKLPDLEDYPIPEDYLHKEEITGKGKKMQKVRTRSFGYRTPKLRQIRAAHVQGGQSLQVLNFVIFPELKYRVPFFGADLVTLPGGHLIALDMQPLFHDDQYKEEFYSGLKPIFDKYAEQLPWGGDFPEEAKQFFSPCFLWTRPAENEKVQNEVFDAFKEYLDTYLSIVDEAPEITDPEELARIEKSQKAYLAYRAEKDPARGMFQRFYGPEWTEEYIHGFLFDLEAKIEDGSYVLPLERTN